MNELLLINEDGQHAWITNEYESIRSAIGNWIEFAGGYGPVSGYVDDEGMLRGLSLNVVGSIALARPVYGPIVVCHPQPDEEGNTLPPDQRAAKAFMELGDIWRTVLAGAEDLGQDLTVLANAVTLPPPQIIAFDKDEFDTWLNTGRRPGE